MPPKAMPPWALKRDISSAGDDSEESSNKLHKTANAIDTSAARAIARNQDFEDLKRRFRPLMYIDPKYQEIMFEINRWEELKSTKKAAPRPVSANIEELQEENRAQAAEIDLLMGEKEELLLIIAQLEDDLRMRDLDPRQMENKIAWLEAEKEQLKARLKTKEENWDKLDEKWRAAKCIMDEAI